MTITVTQLQNYIKGIFDVDAILNDVSVSGEVTNLKRSANGWYFSLKDESGAINCFSYFGTTELRAGSVVIAEGSVNYFVKSGSVSLFARRITLTNNVGSAYRRFAELRDKLLKEGLFDESTKRKIPAICYSVGVVTSETGAVIHDIENVALRRQPFCNIILYPVKVQGEGAEKEICDGISYFNNSDVDVVIVGRGGGSNEDLSAFNAESVARAVASSSKPIVSAVGHGVDYTLCDFAADKRAVTPSEAAEIVTIDCAAEKKRIRAAVSGQISVLQAKISQYTSQVKTFTKLICVTALNGVSSFENSLKRNVDAVCGCLEKRTADMSACLVRNIDKISANNPANLLKRGYSCTKAGGKIISSVRQVGIGDKVAISLSDGELNAIITDRGDKK